MFEQIKAVAVDLGDTLISIQATPTELAQVWTDIYAQLQANGEPNLPPLSLVRQAIDEHVRKQMQLTWREKTEAELDITELFTNALRAAGMPRADEVDFVRQLITLEHQSVWKYVKVGPQALSTLQELRKRGYKLGLVSNFCNLTDVIYNTLEKLGLLPLFDATVISCEIGWRKPSPRIYAEIVRLLQIEPQQILFVGDRLIEDVVGPHQAGMQAVLTHETRQEDMAESEIVPELIIKNFVDLLQYLTGTSLNGV